MRAGFGKPKNRREKLSVSECVGAKVLWSVPGPGGREA